METWRVVESDVLTATKQSHAGTESLALRREPLAHQTPTRLQGPEEPPPRSRELSMKSE